MAAPSRSSPSVREAIGALQRLAEAFQLRRAQLARDSGLSEAQYQVLEQIGSRAFMPSLFAKKRESSAAAVSKVLRTLQDARLVEAAIGDGDARRRSYRLTAEGARLLEGVEAGRRRAIDAVWSDLDASELQRFARFSERLAERLEAYARSQRERSESAPGGKKPSTRRVK